MRLFFRLTLGCSALLITLAGLLLSQRHPPAPALLAYISSTYATGSDIAVVWPDTPTHRPLSGSPADGYLPDRPAWSPDRKWIAFVANAGGSSDIYLLAADGSQLRKLTTDPALDRDPSWSPDGQWLTFISDRTGNDDIYQVRPFATPPRPPQRLTDHPAAEFSPTWSPDGTWIAFILARGSGRELHIMRADGSQARLLAADGAYGPAWSPDGEWIAYLTMRGPLAAELRVIQVNGDKHYRLSVGLATAGGPTWSPDGSQIVFWGRNAAGQADLYLTPPDGTSRRQLTDHPAADLSPLWSPDGRWIAFESMRDGNREIYVIRPDGSHLTNLSRNLGIDAAPAWSSPVERTYHGWLVVGVGLLGLWSAFRRWSTRMYLPQKAPASGASAQRE